MGFAILPRSRLCRLGCFKASFFSEVKHYSNQTSETANFEYITNILKTKCKNVLIMAGAGLSTPSGIPDFRSPGTGLYDNLQQYNLPYPEAIFDINYFQMNPKPFWTLAKELYPGTKYLPNLGHYFIRLLDIKGKLLRIYTQNIDGLERLAGIPADKLVEAHGGFYTASCILCYQNYDPNEVKDHIFQEKVFRCNKKFCKGIVKPDIVFFGEAMPDRFWMHHDDVLLADLLVVIGTSLEVYPFAGIADEIPHNVPRLLLNNAVVGSFGLRKSDTIITGDLLESIKKLATSIGWEKDLQKLHQV